MRTTLNEALRRAGYFALEDSKSKQASFYRRLSRTQFFPRFHLYFQEEPDALVFQLHLDQKKASYLGQTAHSGEYDEPEVLAEGERVFTIITNN